MAKQPNSAKDVRVGWAGLCEALKAKPRPATKIEARLARLAERRTGLAQDERPTPTPTRAQWAALAGRLGGNAQ
jgi:hypothetical protein